MIHGRRDIWLYAIILVAIVDLSVALFIAIVWPPEDWSNLIPPALALASFLSFFLGLNGARRTYQIHELAEELRRLLERDRLTDVATRDFFFKCMTEAPDAYGLSLMIDIDHFKSVNDTYGHSTGDLVIRHVAQILRRNCRPEDIVCRYGGEEFVVFIHGVGEEGGLEVAERLRHAIGNCAMSHEDTDLRVTVSVGGSLKQRKDGIDRAIGDADAALYKAKALGRNRSIMSWLRPEEAGRSAA